MTDREQTKNTTIPEKKMALIANILKSRELLTPREYGIMQLYYKCGLSHDEIAHIFKTERSTISHSMRNIRRKIRSEALKNTTSAPMVEERVQESA